ESMRLYGIKPMGELLRIFVALHSQEHAAQQKSKQDVALGFTRMVQLRGLEREHDRNARANQDKGVESANWLAQMDVVGRRPGNGTEPKHDVRADQPGEKHDLR